jgi:hypothetical protein
MLSLPSSNPRLDLQSLQTSQLAKKMSKLMVKPTLLSIIHLCLLVIRLEIIWFRKWPQEITNSIQSITSLIIKSTDIARSLTERLVPSISMK